jgi:phosphotransferase system HPr (HPr) family protein
MNALATPPSGAPPQPAIPHPAGAPALRRTFVLLNLPGLHCRPAALIVRTLNDFASDAAVECGGASASGRSIIELLSLAAGYGTPLTFVISGPDAKNAMAALERLFKTNFAQAYAEKPKAAASGGKLNPPQR